MVGLPMLRLWGFLFSYTSFGRLTAVPNGPRVYINAQAVGLWG